MFVWIASTVLPSVMDQMCLKIMRSQVFFFLAGWGEEVSIKLASVSREANSYIVTQLAKEFFVFYETQRLITIFSRPVTCPGPEPDEYLHVPISCICIYFRSILILSGSICSKVYLVISFLQYI